MRSKTFLLAVLAVLAAVNVVSAGGPHPRVWLDPASLSSLQQRASANAAAWLKVKARCDLYLTGQVEYPDGNSYPPTGSVGQGYQGSDYFDPVINVGLCYQVSRSIDQPKASAYGSKGVDILLHMSDPAHSPNPLRDSGYGIRYYGVGMAIGYDWLYDAMTAAQRTQVYTALNTWIEAFDTGGFGRDHPQGNYFAGYYAAKGIAALATEDDNPKASAQWGDWLNRLHGQMVQPYYAAYMKGGGWPEGWNYGLLATVNMNWPVLAAKTAKQLDLVHAAGTPFSFPIDQGLHLIHFAWPNRLTWDDGNALPNAGDNPSATSRYLLTVLAGLSEIWQAPSAPEVHRFAREIRGLQSQAISEWQEFLFWNDTASERDYTNLSRSYLAEGMNIAAVRSSWQTDATWASFTAGPYVNYPGSGEQWEDQGTLAIVRGGTPLLVNTTGTLMRNTPGTNDGSAFWDAAYDDMYGNWDVNPALGNRTIFNIFYVRGAGRYGQIAIPPSQVRTRVTRFEDSGNYVLMRGMYLEDMYRKDTNGSTPLVASWTRDVLYLRPNLFVVYDRTTRGSGGIDQWQAFHLATSVAEVAAPAPGAHRFDVTTRGTFAGAVTTLLPENHSTTVLNLFNSSKVYRLEVRPADQALSQRWLTVFDTAASPAQVAQATRLPTTNQNAVALLLASPTGNSVMIADAGAAPQALTGDISYTVPAVFTRHVFTDLPVNSDFSARLSTGSGGQTLTVSAGTGFRSSASGALCLQTMADGTVASCAALQPPASPTSLRVQ